MNKKRIYCLSICWVLFSLVGNIFVYASPSAFTRLSLHPRAAALGNSQVASSSGSTALTWNPAGIALEKNNEWAFMGSQAYETTYLRVDTLFQTPHLPLSIGYLHADFGSTSHTAQNSTTSRLEKTSGSSSYLGQKLSIGTSSILKNGFYLEQN